MNFMHIDLFTYTILISSSFISSPKDDICSFQFPHAKAQIPGTVISKGHINTRNFKTKVSKLSVIVTKQLHYGRLNEVGWL
jgi:hypothetical protein